MLSLFVLFSLVSCGIDRDEEEDAHEHQDHHAPERCGAPLYRSPQGSAHTHNGAFGVHVAAQTCGSGMKPPSVGGFSRGVEGYTSYVGQSTCDPSAKSGVTAFKDLLLATYPCTASYGIVRACNVGGTSEHKEGRAFDWGVSAFTQKHVADSLIQWLLATDAQGNKHAMARRLGIMYMVWNKQIWRSYRSPDTWSAYTGSNPHTDHVHFSFGWDGANKKTSFWTGGATEVCSATQNQNCAGFGCQCVSGSCAGAFVPAMDAPPKKPTIVRSLVVDASITSARVVLAQGRAVRPKKKKTVVVLGAIVPITSVRADFAQGRAVRSKKKPSANKKAVDVSITSVREAHATATDAPPNSKPIAQQRVVVAKT